MQIYEQHRGDKPHLGNTIASSSHTARKRRVRVAQQVLGEVGPLDSATPRVNAHEPTGRSVPQATDVHGSYRLQLFFRFGGL